MSTREGSEIDGAKALASFVRTLHTPAAIFDSTGTVREANSAWSTITGPAVRDIRQLLVPADQPVMTACLRSLDSQACPPPFEAQLATGRWAQMQIQPFGRAEDNLWLCTATDIHELKSRYDILTNQDRMQRDALNASGDYMDDSQVRLTLATAVGGIGIWDFDISTEQLHCDETWHSIMGLDPTRPITSVEEFMPYVHPDDVDQVTEVPRTVAALVASEQDYTNAFRILRSDGEVRWLRSAACLIQDQSGAPARAIGFVLDITDSLRGQMALQEANQTLEKERVILAQQSREDALTGLPNRRWLSAELDRIVADAHRTGNPVSVSMIDLDYFKRYNDRHGHLDGDTVLVKFANCLKQVARRTDFAARYGGEEFVLIQAGTTDPLPTVRRLFDLLDEIALPHPDSPYGQVTISCGSAVFRDGANLDPEHMLEAADQALYEAKTSGRNRFILR